MKSFTKPKDVRYVDMAIWIDSHIYNKNFDEETAYKYLYLLSDMLAHKCHYYTKESDYDDFALYCASRVYFRLTNKKQFDENSKITKIKSVLNYLKSSLYPIRCDYENKIVCREPATYVDDFTARVDDLYKINSFSDFSKVDFALYTEDISKTIKQFVKETPYGNTDEFDNVYLSCLITFLNMVTLESNVKEKIQDYNDNKIAKAYSQISKDSVILYHLDDTMKDYIYVLVNKIKQLLADDISYILKSNEYSEDIVKDILLSRKSEDNDGDCCEES